MSVSVENSESWVDPLTGVEHRDLTGREHAIIFTLNDTALDRDQAKEALKAAQDLAESFQRRCHELETSLRRAEATLRWYADRANIHLDGTAYGHGRVAEDGEILWDQGSRARGTLAGLKREAAAREPVDCERDCFDRCQGACGDISYLSSNTL